MLEEVGKKRRIRRKQPWEVKDKKTDGGKGWRVRNKKEAYFTDPPKARISIVKVNNVGGKGEDAKPGKGKKYEMD